MYRKRESAKEEGERNGKEKTYNKKNALDVVACVQQGPFYIRLSSVNFVTSCIRLLTV